MLRFGYKLMSEEHAPAALVDNARSAEAAGFDFVAISDHFHPWLRSQGHSPYAWTVLGAIAARTDRIGLVTAVTCPFLRYHPVIVAQAAATLACLSGERLTLGLGTGEELNEHVVGRGWPTPAVRREMLAESIEILRLLWRGGTRSYRGRHFEVAQAELFDLPERPPPIAVAAGGSAGAVFAAKHAAGLFATRPTVRSSMPGTPPAGAARRTPRSRFAGRATRRRPYGSRTTVSGSGCSAGRSWQICRTRRTSRRRPLGSDRRTSRR
jgi:G6PDH family F420-dependent oxidoreductase